MQNNASPAGEKRVKEDNELIAKFMNLKSFEDSRYGKLWHDPLGSNTSQFDLKYHSSWDWLKPVVDKIFTYSLVYKDQTQRLRKTSIVVNIIPCWQICVDFITWYNQQTPSNGK